MISKVWDVKQLPMEDKDKKNYDGSDERIVLRVWKLCIIIIIVIM